MIQTTTPNIEGKKINSYYRIVTGEVILGANFFKDILASLTNVLGGRSQAYEDSLNEARQAALKEMSDKAQVMGANAVIGIDIDYETIGSDTSMLMVTCSGTAVSIE
ncbi:MAG: YbjQ family protein [Patescibacteria group bacterium]